MGIADSCVKSKDWIDGVACICNALQFASGIMLYNCEVYVLSGYNDRLLAIYISGSFLLFVLFAASMTVCLCEAIANQTRHHEAPSSVYLVESQRFLEHSQDKENRTQRPNQLIFNEVLNTYK